MALTKPQTHFESEIPDQYQSVTATGAFAVADASMRSGQLSILELQHLLGSVLSPGADVAPQRKWPLAYGLAIVLVSSALLWTGIAYGIGSFV